MGTVYRWNTKSLWLNGKICNFIEREIYVAWLACEIFLGHKFRSINSNRRGMVSLLF